MNTGRMEAFTDGVIAVAITIMVLDMKVPAGTDLHALTESAPVFLAYVLSYINVGIFWNNHHHMLHATEHVDGKAMGQSVPAVLDHTDPVRTPLDRRQRDRGAPRGRLRRGAFNGHHRLSLAGKGDYPL